jgi:hypothetical protein
MAREWYPCATAPLAVTRPLSIDFWSMPCCDINHAGHLPPEIQTGVLWYDYFAGLEGSKLFDHLHNDYFLDLLHYDYYARRNSEKCEALNQFRKERQFNRRVGVTSSVRIHTDGTDTLSSFLNRAQNERSHSEGSRTALIALDSLGPPLREPTWGRILPAFAQCYDHIIGLIHSPRRGLRDWKTFLNTTCGNDFFEQSVWSSASQCDVVIVTSAGLMETDPGLCTDATTEILAGELMRRLGYALLNREVLDQVLSVHQTEEKRRPRLFALSSSTRKDRLGIYKVRPYSEYKCDLDQHHQVMERQDDIVSGAFGHWVKGERQLNIATHIEHPWRDYFAEIEANTAAPPPPPPLGPPWPRRPPPLGWKLLFEAPAPAYKPNSECVRRAGALDLITLWPFSFDAEAEPSS